MNEKAVVGKRPKLQDQEDAPNYLGKLIRVVSISRASL